MRIMKSNFGKRDSKEGFTGGRIPTPGTRKEFFPRNEARHPEDDNGQGRSDDEGEEERGQGCATFPHRGQR